MADEVFRRTMEVTDAERLLIDQVWMDVLHRNRWRRRGWRLFHRLRAFLSLLARTENGWFHVLPHPFREGGEEVRKMPMPRRWQQ